MEITIPMEAFDHDVYGPILERYERRLYREKIFPNDNSSQTHTAFNIDELDQGALGLMLAIDGTTLTGYNFYCVVLASKLDEPVPESFPNCWKDEEAGELKTLREYHAQFVSVKDDKALLRIGIGLGNGNHSSLTSYTDEILREWIAEYDPTTENTYTSEAECIAIKAEYEGEITE